MWRTIGWRPGQLSVLVLLIRRSRRPTSSRSSIVISACCPAWHSRFPQHRHPGGRGIALAGPIRASVRDVDAPCSSACSRRAGGLGVSAQPARDSDPRVVVPAFAVGTLPAMYLLGYSLNNLSADGVDHRDRLRGRRRHCGHRKRLALCEAARNSLVAALKGGATDRVHHRFFQLRCRC